MSSFAARKEDEAKAAMPSPWLQERGSTGLRHGLQGPQERGQVQDRQVPGGTQGQGHAFECCKAGGGKEGQEGYSQGRTGAETSRAVSGCLEIPQGHRQGKGQGGRQGERRRRGREAGGGNEEGVGPCWWRGGTCPPFPRAPLQTRRGAWHGR